MAVGKASKFGVILVASESDERCERLGLALAGVGVEVLEVPDVYLALGELVACSREHPVAVVVQASCVEGSEAEFFPMARRLVRDVRTYVLQARVGEERAVATAVSAGATVLETNTLSLKEWASSLVQPARQPGAPGDDLAAETAGPVPAPAVAPRMNWASAEPEMLIEEIAEPVEPEPPSDTDDIRRPESASAALEDLATEAVPAVSEIPLGCPAGEESAEAEATEAPEPEKPRQDERVPESQDVRFARPIEVPASWGQPGGEAESNSPIRAEDDGVIPAVPWCPPAGRPARTPPSARGISHTPTPGPTAPPNEDLHLTREELDALLGDPADPPNLRRFRP